MRYRILHTIIPIAVLAVCAAAPSAQNRHVEDFTTTTYQDAAATSADWNTGAGELRLYPFTPSVVAGYPTTGNAVDVEVDGNLAFVAVDGDGLKIFDITDPATLTLVGSYSTPAPAKYVTVSGSFAYVTCGLAGVQVIDVSDPTSPFLAGSYPTATFAHDIVIEGETAFVAVDVAGLLILDVSTPTPSYVSEIDTPGSAWGVAVGDGLACVADYDGGIAVFDVTDRTAPSLVGSHATTGYAYAATIRDGTAFVAVGTAGLEIYSLYTFMDPILVGSLDTPGGFLDLALHGETVFAADYAVGLREIDVTDPTQPTFVSLIDTPGSPRAVAAYGDHVMVADYTAGLQSVAVWAPTSPRLLYSGENVSEAWKVIRDGDRVMVLSGTYNYVFAKVAPGPTLEIVGQGDFFGYYMQDVAIAGDLIFVAGGQVMSFSLGGSLLDSYYDTNAYLVEVDDHHVYAVTSDELLVLGYTEAGLLEFQKSYPAYWGRDLKVRSGLVYLVGSQGTFDIIDTNGPGAPTLVGSTSTYGQPWELALVGDLAVVANGGSVRIMDISDPANPTRRGSIDIGGEAYRLSVTGNYALVSCGEAGFQIIDFSDPDAPVRAAKAQSLDLAYDCEAWGGMAIAAEGYMGITLYQIFQDEVRGGENLGVSLTVAPALDEMSVVRLTTTETGAVSWDVTADGWFNWQTVPVDGNAHRLAVPGTDLRWRAELGWEPGLASSVSDVTVQWYSDHGLITSVSDVPDDQGGWVRVNFLRSGCDFATEPSLPATGYWVHQRVDDPVLKARVRTAPSAPAGAGKGFEAAPAVLGEVRRLGDREFLVSGGPAATGIPPGVWEVVASVPAMQQESYQVRVPTVADSTAAGPAMSVFIVTTHTTDPTAWFVCRPDSGCSADNIAPGVPQGMSAAYASGGVTLDWDDAPEADFQYYRVYRSAEPVFVPGPASLVHETAESAWTDPATDPWDYHYMVTVLDHAGNESEPVAFDALTSVGDRTPRVTALQGASPNPFNPSTTIRFSLATSGRARLTVYDLSGRRVATLLDEYREAGRQKVVWEGRDDSGQRVSSGVYLYRLEADGFSGTKRMLLVK